MAGTGPESREERDLIHREREPANRVNVMLTQLGHHTWPFGQTTLDTIRGPFDSHGLMEEINVSALKAQ